MKFLISSFMFCMVLVFSVSVFAEEQQKTEVSPTPVKSKLSIPAVNTVLSEIANTVLAEVNTGYQDPVLKALNFSLDETFTDLDKWRLGGEVSATLKRSAWSDKSTTGFIKAQGQISELENNQVEMALRGELGVKSDSLALLQFVSQKIQKNGECEPSKTQEIDSFEKLIESRLCAAVLEMTLVQDYTSAAEILMSAYVSLGNYVVKAMNEASTPEEKAVSKKMLEQFNRTKISNDKGILTFTMKKYGIQFFNIEELVVTLSEGKFSVAISIKVVEPMVLGMVMRLKNDFEKYLTELQSRDKGITKAIKGFILGYAEIVSQIILDEKPVR